MRKLVLFLVLICLSLVVFALDSPLVSYYSEDTSSHACKPASADCAYLNAVYVDSNYLANCSSGTKVLGLSGSTNAHAEVPGFNFYDTNICMKSDIFSSGTCYYKSAQDCNSGDSCLFALNSTTNSHLSKCNTFGAGETKFCCKKGITIEAAVVPPVISNSNCDLSFVSADNVKFGEQSAITFYCKTQQDVNIYLFTGKGDLLFGPETDLDLRNLQCNSSGRTLFKAFSLPEGSSNNFLIRVVSKDCAKDVYFTAATKETKMTIPDANPLIAVLVCFMVLVMVLGSRKVNK